MFDMQWSLWGKLCVPDLGSASARYRYLIDIRDDFFSVPISLYALSYQRHLSELCCIVIASVIKNVHDSSILVLSSRLSRIQYP
jgi:hypothetical protein